MNLLQLHYFKILAEKEHLLSSAKAIHISAPALSSSISKLEEELGVELFDHVGRGLRLNQNGRILYVHVCNIFSELDMVEHKFRSTASQSEQTVNVAVATPANWVYVFSAFIRAYPEISVSHTVLRKDAFRDPEILRLYDLIITDIGEISDKTYEHRFIVEDPPTVLLRQDHPLAQRKIISLAELKNEPFIALPKYYAPRDYFDGGCKLAGFTPTIVAETEYQLRANLVEDGVGIAFSSVLGSRAVRNPAIKAVRVSYPPNPRIQTVFWRADQELSPAATRFRDFLVHFYQAPGNAIPQNQS